MGVHGVQPEEQERPQAFEVDLELSVDLARAGESDSLDDTIDYGVICEEVTRVISTERYALIERLAERIAAVCSADPRVTEVVVEVRKLRPPVRVVLGSVGVRIER